MIENELKQFIEISKESLKRVLPTERLAMEEHLFSLNVNFMHLMQLQWSKTTLKSTDSYRMFLAEQCLYHLIAAGITGELNMDDLYDSFLESYGRFSVKLTPELCDNLIISISTLNDIDMQEYRFGPIEKAAFALYVVLQTSNSTIIEFLDHYKSWQKEQKVI